MQILVRNIRMPVEALEGDIKRKAEARLSGVLPHEAIRNRAIYRRSVDTRHKTITLVFSVLIETDANISQKALAACDAVIMEEERPIDETAYGDEVPSERPVLVGFGPCGMFAALLLAERGYRPLVLERGDSVAVRSAKVGHFFSTGELDTETNIQFGAGGAGTFSDGKLVTRINDSLCHYVLEKFVEFGAPAEILTQAKPHIGTDKLLNVVANIDRRIRELGGEIRYLTRFCGIVFQNGVASAVKTSDGEIPCGQLILATGHSARDTYADLMQSGFSVVPKPFSVGVRIEHLQNDIDTAIYGTYAGHPKLGHAEYALSKRQGEDCVYTFCMCPGGEVIAAASEAGGVVTNGMSRYRRDGKNANAALAVAVSCENPIEFQRQLERSAFASGGGNYDAPVQTVGDFLAGKHGTEPSRILPTYRHGRVKTADLSALFPQKINAMLRLGLNDFQKKIPGFAAADAVLTGVETRTSAPVRILRNEQLLAIGYDNVYPCGEGAGYAGGITSAAVDGLRVAETIIKRYRPYAKG